MKIALNFTFIDKKTSDLKNNNNCILTAASPIFTSKTDERWKTRIELNNWTLHGYDLFNLLNQTSLFSETCTMMIYVSENLNQLFNFSGQYRACRMFLCNRALQVLTCWYPSAQSHGRFQPGLKLRPTQLGEILLQLSRHFSPDETL